MARTADVDMTSVPALEPATFPSRIESDSRGSSGCGSQGNVSAATVSGPGINASG
jgi:hypothetical protein